MVTAMALVKPPRQPAAGGVATVGAREPSGPAVLKEGRLALCFRAVLLEERWQRQGTCKCRIDNGIENTDPVKKKEKNVLTEEDIASGYRLACQTFLNGNVQVSW